MHRQIVERTRRTGAGTLMRQQTGRKNLRIRSDAVDRIFVVLRGGHAAHVTARELRAVDIDADGNGIRAGQIGFRNRIERSRDVIARGQRSRWNEAVGARLQETRRRTGEQHGTGNAQHVAARGRLHTEKLSTAVRVPASAERSSFRYANTRSRTIRRTNSRRTSRGSALSSRWAGVLAPPRT